MKICLKCEMGFDSDGWVCPACGYSPKHIQGFTAHAPHLAHGGGGFKVGHFEALAKLEGQNFWFRSRNKLIVWALKKYGPGGGDFLEIGCGTGFVLSGLLKKLPEYQLHGSEIFVAGFSYAAARVPQADFMQMDARKIPFSSEFDALGAFDVLEHISEDEDVLGEAYRALKPGGLLLLSVPQHRWLWSASDEHACHVRRYTAKEIHEKLTSKGFQVKRSTSFVFFLLPIMLLSRLKAKEKYNPDSELKIPQALNMAFLGVMLLELAFIQLGLNFPMGGSRLIVAKK
jgi:SAM-dependent methyltransferase